MGCFYELFCLQMYIMFVSCYVTGRESALESILKRADIEIFK